MNKKTHISQEDLQRIFSISSASTIYRYIRNEILPKPVKDAYGETLFDRQQICKIIGLETIPNEPFITSEEALKILGLSQGYRSTIRPYCKRNKIPFYTFSNSKGTKTYFFRSELEKYAEYSVKWDNDFPDFIVRNFFFREIFKVFMHPSYIKGLSSNEQIILQGVFLEQKTLAEMANELSYSKERVRQALILACKRGYYSVNQFNARLKMTDEVIYENIRLIAQNKYLTSHLKIESSEEQRIAPSFNHIDTHSYSPRIRALIKAMEANTLSDITMFRRSDVEKFRGAGKKTVDELEQLLKDNGLMWKEEEFKPKKITKQESLELMSKALTPPAKKVIEAKPLPDWFDEKVREVLKGVYKQDKAGAMLLIYDIAEEKGEDMPYGAIQVLNWIRENKK